jgi:hypothetical protein
MKEIREISKIKGIKLYLMKKNMINQMNEDSLREMDADFSIHARGINRKTEFIKNNFTFLSNED